MTRIAGLPASAIEDLRSRPLGGLADRIWRLEGEARELRDQAVDLLYEAVPKLPSEQRAFVLEVKRDCFNGRDLEDHRGEEGWRAVEEAGGTVIRRLTEVEREREEAGERLRKLYYAERSRTAKALLALSGHRNLRRGMALASPRLVESVDKLLQGETLVRRKRRSAEESLLRYASRAALKLSPYSSLTRVGLCELEASGRARGVEREGETTGLELRGARWSEHPLVQLRRYSLNQIWQKLAAEPEIRSGLEIELNGSLIEIEPGHFLFQRPGFWHWPGDGVPVRYQLPALSRLQLEGSLVDWLRENLPNREWTYGELEARLAGESGLGSAEAARSTLSQLLDLGLLILLPPWPVQAAPLEERLERFLRTRLPGSGAAEALADLIDREEGWTRGDEPQKRVRGLHRSHRLFRRSVGLPPAHSQQSEEGGEGKGDFYEDVFLRPRTGAGGIARLPRSVAGELLATARPLARLAHVFHPRHDFLTLVAHHLDDRGTAAGGGVPLLPLFAELRPFWKEYVAFLNQPSAERRDRCFDPLELDGVRALQHLRRGVRRRLEASVKRVEDEDILPVFRLEEMAEEVPPQLRLPIGAALFAQPADARGRRWVVNSFLEGTGRWSSRFTSAMDPESAERFVAPLMERSVLGGEEPSYLLDLLSVRGDTVNLHRIQTLKVLEMPGEPCRLPGDRKVRLADLVVRRHAGNGAPELVDRRGYRYLPVFLSPSSWDLLPTLVKFLTLFGPSPMYLPLELSGAGCKEDEAEEGEVLPRLVLGPLVLRRKSWCLPTAPLQRELEGADQVEAFLAVDRWRRARNLPERVFLSEEMEFEVGGERRVRTKPQYLDFSAPLFVEMFHSIVAKGPRTLRFEEMLPEPSSFPTDGEGERWACELILDDRGFHPVGGEVRSHPPDVVREDGTVPLPSGEGVYSTEPIEAR